jgi:cation:H+ antiporter
VVVCCIIIWRASDGFSLASDYIGRNLSDGVRGATLNAIASSMPEVFTSLFFLFYLHDTNGFSGGIGTTAGSAIFNGMIIPAFVIMVVVFSGIAKNIKVSTKVFARDGIALILSEVIFIMILSGSVLHWWHGLLLMLIYFTYLFVMLFFMSKTKLTEEDHLQTFARDEMDVKSVFRSILTFDLEYLIIGKRKLRSTNAWILLLVSTLFMALVCLLLVQACEWLGSHHYKIPFLGEFNGLGIPILFVAVILAAMASSIPDTVLSMKDARKGNYDDAVSNALGSNIFDICFALGFPLFIYTLINGPIYMSQEVIDLSSELRMLLLVLTIFTVLIYVIGNSLGIFKAYLLLGLYLVFTMYVVGVSIGNVTSIQIAAKLRDMVKFFNIFG